MSSGTPLEVTATICFDVAIMRWADRTPDDSFAALVDQVFGFAQIAHNVRSSAVTALDPHTLDALTRARYVSLTTYRKDGTPVATPVWHVVHGGMLYVWTEADSWKVKRLRRDPRVKVVVCDVRGRTKPGAAEATGTGRVLDEEGREKVRRLLGRKYLLARVGDVWSTVTGRRRRRPIVALEISF